jgi:hypothetical protein
MDLAPQFHPVQVAAQESRSQRLTEPDQSSASKILNIGAGTAVALMTAVGRAMSEPGLRCFWPPRSYDVQGYENAARVCSTGGPVAGVRCSRGGRTISIGKLSY